MAWATRASLRPLAILIFVLIFQALVLFLGPSADDIEGSNYISDASISQGFLHPANVKGYFTIPRRSITTLREHSSRLSQHFLPLANTSYHSPHFIRPAFEDIVKDHKNNVITGDLQFLLDFAIVGHAKCGTSTMMKWLGEHPQVLSRDQELPHLTLGKVGLFAKNCYNLDENGDPTKFRAYKNPTDIQNLRAIRLLRQYFPQTRLFVGIRHPILWFESFYNHRIQNTGRMPDPNTLGGGCYKDSQGVCGQRADYHVALVRLGKSNYTYEQDAFNPGEWNGIVRDNPPHTPNPIFLYDTQQLSDTDEERSAQFRRDIQQFIGLSTPLPPVIHYSPGKILNATLQAERDAMKMDICSDKYTELRKTLLERAQRAAFYIRKYFMNAPGVVVSSPDYFVQVLDLYQRDPCEERDTNSTKK